MTNCNVDLMVAGSSSLPRSCQQCGLGPCNRGYTPAQVKAARDAWGGAAHGNRTDTAARVNAALSDLQASGLPPVKHEPPPMPDCKPARPEAFDVPFNEGDSPYPSDPETIGRARAALESLGLTLDADFVLRYIDPGARDVYALDAFIRVAYSAMAGSKDEAREAWARTRRRFEAAIGTLREAHYTYSDGAERWKPPLGKAKPTREEQIETISQAIAQFLDAAGMFAGIDWHDARDLNMLAEAILKAQQQ